jgi:hypothetical protein
VFTLPKRLRIFFKYDRKLLGKLAKAAWETIRDVFIEETEIKDALPAMIAGIQTFGDLINAHPHIHALCPDGIFLDSGTFVKVDTLPMDKVLEIWENKVFEFLLLEKKISLDVVDAIRSWEHSGFSVNNDVQIKADDKKGMQSIIEYIARCPLSLARIIKLTNDGKVIYRATKTSCLPFPELGNENLKAGVNRNFEVFEPLDFLAQVAQHIPNKGEHLIRYYGWYSNKMRGMRNKKAEEGKLPKSQLLKKRCSLTWAILIKSVYEVDPMLCPACGGEMNIISLIDGKHQPSVVTKILKSRLAG